MTQMTDPSTDTITLDIAGMTCGHCVANVQKALKSVPGITSAQVSVGSATIAVDAGDGARAIGMAIDAIAQAGYTATTAGGKAGASPAPTSCCGAPRRQ